MTTSTVVQIANMLLYWCVNYTAIIPARTTPAIQPNYVEYLL